MKILLVSLYLVEYGLELANELSKKHRVHLVLCKKRVQRTLGDHLDAKLAPNVTYTVLPYRSVLSPSTVWCLFAILKMYWQFRPHAVHIQECRNPLNLVFALFRFCPLIATIHDVVLHPGVEQDNTSEKSLRILRFVRERCYNAIIVHGEALRTHFLKSFSRSPKDVHAIAHGPLFSFVPGKSSTIVEEPNTVLFFGRMQKYKGLKYLIESEPLVSKQIKDYKIIIAGKGDELNAHKPQLAHNPRFEIHDDYIPNEMVSSFFNRAAAVVMPYIEASQSGIAAMAFAFGKPVITTDVGSLAEMVTHGRTGTIVLPGDTVALAQAIIDMLGNEKIRKKMAVNIKEDLLTQYGWNPIADATIRVYQSAMAQAQEGT